MAGVLGVGSEAALHADALGAQYGLLLFILPTAASLQPHLSWSESRYRWDIVDLNIVMSCSWDSWEAPSIVIPLGNFPVDSLVESTTSKAWNSAFEPGKRRIEVTLISEFPEKNTFGTGET